MMDKEAIVKKQTVLNIKLPADERSHDGQRGYCNET